MFGITDISGFLIATIMIIILPGPNSLYCLSVSASQGKRAGFLAATGIVIGDSILIIATILGAGTLLRLYPAVFDTIKLVGGLYLAYLGIRLLMGAYQTFVNRHILANSPVALAKPTHQNYLMRALSLSLTNPKAILFFLSFFVQFVDPAYPRPYISFLILALILQVVSISYLSLLIIAGKGLAYRFASRPWLGISGMSLIGVLFLGFAVNLWMSKLV